MGKRTWSLALCLALIAGVSTSLPVAAQEASTEIPAVVQLEDPFGDANGLNDQGGVCVGSPLPPTCTPKEGDHATPADAGNASDIGKVWFTDDATTVSAHIQTELPPPGSQALRYDVYTAPGEGTAASSTLGCVRFVAIMEGVAQGQQTTWRGPSVSKFFDACNDGTNWFNNGVEAKLELLTAADGTGVIKMTADKANSPFLATGEVLAGTTAVSRVAYGDPATVAGSAFFIDNTKVGTDYAITGGGAPQVKEPNKPTQPPGKADPPGKGKKKGCGKDKGKAKQKGACPAPPPPPAPGCPAYVPGEQGAEAETSVVTEAATEDAPMEITIAAPAGDPVALPAAFQNIQVDSAAAEAGLHIRYEFPIQDDHDIYLNYSDGSEAAHAAGFNQFPFIPNPTGIFGTDGTGNGGHSEQGAEVLDGIRTADCAGYTLQMDSFISEGGDMTLKLWLGEAQNDPAAPGGAESAMEMFYRVMGL